MHHVEAVVCYWLFCIRFLLIPAFQTPSDVCFSPPPGEGSGPAANHRAAGGHDTLRGRLLRVLGGPEGVKRGVFRGARREEGGHRRRQRLRVGHLTLSRPGPKRRPGVARPQLYVARKSYRQTSASAAAAAHCGVGAASQAESQADNWFPVCSQEEHHCAPVVPLLRAPAGEHLHRGAEYPRRQPRQPEEVFGGRPTGLQHTHTHTRKLLTMHTQKCFFYESVCLD